jgi:hypothetical protein
VSVGTGVSVGSAGDSSVGSGVSVGTGADVSAGGEVTAGDTGVTVGGTSSAGGAVSAVTQAETTIAVTTRIEKVSMSRLFVIHFPPFQLVSDQAKATVRYEDTEHFIL